MPDDPLWYILIGKKIIYIYFLPDLPLHHNYNRDTVSFILIQLEK